MDRARKGMWDLLDKTEGRAVGSSSNAHAREMKRQGYSAKHSALEKKTGVKKVEGYHRKLSDVMKKHSFGPTFVNKPEKKVGKGDRIIK